MEVSAGVILFLREKDDKLFLLLRYPSGHWDFVKGHLEPGETYMQTALRESEEETGITDITFLDGFEKCIRYSYMYGKQRMQKRVVFFLASTGTKKVVLSREHRDFMWANYEDSMRRITYNNARWLLRHARRFLDLAGI